jgi:hypothetical protein
MKSSDGSRTTITTHGVAFKPWSNNPSNANHHTVPTYRFNLDNWWLDENHPKMLFDEYTKLAYYWLNYGW